MLFFVGLHVDYSGHVVRLGKVIYPSPSGPLVHPHRTHKRIDPGSKGFFSELGSDPCDSRLVWTWNRVPHRGLDREDINCGENPFENGMVSMVGRVDRFCRVISFVTNLKSVFTSGSVDSSEVALESLNVFPFSKYVRLPIITFIPIKLKLYGFIEVVPPYYLIVIEILRVQG